MDLPSNLPIPPATHKRSRRVQDAARLYIHQGVVVIAELSRQTGVSPIGLSKARDKDKWDEFRLELSKLSMRSMYDGGIESLRTDHQMKMIMAEQEMQITIVETLVKQRNRILDSLENLDPGTKAYSSAMSSLEMVRKSIEDTIGLNDYRDEKSSAIKKARPISTGRGVTGKVVEV